MLPLPTDLVERTDRPAYRPFRATVAGVTPLAEHFVRVTFTGPDFDVFGTDALDQRIKLLFPLPGIGMSDIGADDPAAIDEGSWFTRWRDLPDAARNPLRTYTVRAVRPEHRELDVDFVAHGIGGPAAAWLATATAGDELVIVGPDARSINSAAGIDWHPGIASEYLLAGDETAAPAICSILESLPEGTSAAAFIEVPSVADALPIESRANVTVSWLGRGDAAVGSRLDEAVRDWVAGHPSLVEAARSSVPQQLDDVDVDTETLWDSPEAVASGEFYAWIAGESAMVKAVRRFLVTETGIDRRRVAFMGYWRLGKAEAQE